MVKMTINLLFQSNPPIDEVMPRTAWFGSNLLVCRSVVYNSIFSVQIIVSDNF